MFIHLGEDVLIKTNDVLIILEFELMEENEINRLFIDQCLENKKLIDVGEKATKSIVIADDAVYFSPFSPMTLKKRAESDWAQDPY